MFTSTSKIENYFTLTTSIVSLIALPSVLSAKPSYAAIINGGFETGYTGWSIIGDTSVQTDNSFGSGPTQGEFEAFLSTASILNDNFNFSGKDAVNRADLEAFLGLAPESLNNFGNGGIFSVIEGAAIKQTFTAKAGDTLSFDFNFLTDEYTPSPDFNSFAFVVLNSTTTEVADTFSNFYSSSTFFNNETGFYSYSTILPTTGSYTLGLGVVDRGEAFSSGLLIDNVRTVPVPEPSPKWSVVALSALLGIRLLKGKRSLRRMSTD